MSKLYFITNNHELFYSIYTNKAIIVASPDKTKMQNFSNVLKRNKQIRKKWINKCTLQYQRLDDKMYFELEENTLSTTDDNNIKLSYIDMDDLNSARFFNFAYQMSNIELFIMFDYIFDIRDICLTLQGVIIDKPENDDVFDMYSYLDALYQMK